MKYLSFPLFALTVIVVTSFKNKPRSFLNSEVNSSFVKVKANLYFCKFEASSKDYKAFHTALLQANQSEEYIANLLDTVKWSKGEGTNKPLVVYYHSLRSYDKYPVATVKYESAMSYCKWLTETYNADPLRKFKKVVFRLPTES